MSVKVCVAVPNGGTVKSRAMTDLICAMFSHPEYGYVLADTEGTLGPQNRWLACKQAIDTGCDYVWLIDNDMAFPPDTLPRLLAHDKDVIGAAYHYRRLPLMTTVKRLDQTGAIIIPDSLPTELFIAHAIGSGCKLIRVDALQRIPQPWFALAWGPDGGLSKTDDVWFCEQAQSVGIDIYCDPTIECFHVGDFLY